MLDWHLLNMPITFHPKQGMVLMCDFAGFVPPEMVKRRHVIVVSPRYRRHTGVCLVVPLSTVPPVEIEPHHFEIPAGKYPFMDCCKSSWVKGDMLSCVSFGRLDRVLLYGRYASPSLCPEDLKAVQNAVLKALGV